MPRKNLCLICATDEGIFLNIFESDKSFRNNIEACLSFKVQKSQVVSECICHKCAFELENCSRFVEKYHNSKRGYQRTSFRQRGRCRFCLEPGKKGYIYSLHVEAPVNTVVKKIEEIFEDHITNNDGSSICLDCRYNLDVLFDMRKVFKETSLPNSQKVFNEKIETHVVKRKTTFIQSPRLTSLASWDDEDCPKRMTKRKVNSSSPFGNTSKSIVNERKCDECSSIIAKSKDIYKVHSTGHKYCHKCWPTIHHKKSSKNNKQNASNSGSDTKDCSVFLKDVLTTHNLSDMKNKFFLKSEVDNNGTRTYVISDDSEIDDQPTASKNTRKPPKRSFSEPESKPQKKMKKEPDEPLRRSTRAASVMLESIPDQKKSAKRRVSETATSDVKIERRGRPRKCTKIDLLVVEPLDDGSDEKKASKTGKKSKMPTKETPKLKKRTRAKSNSSSSSSSSKVSLQKNLEKIDGIDTILDSDAEGNQPYICSICSTEFENRVKGKTHELTHSKKLGVILEKVPVPESTEQEVGNEIIKDEGDISKIDSVSKVDFEKISSENPDVQKTTGQDSFLVTQTETRSEEGKNEKVSINPDESQFGINESLDGVNDTNGQENHDDVEDKNINSEKSLVDSEVFSETGKDMQEISCEQKKKDDSELQMNESELAIIDDQNLQNENTEPIKPKENIEEECERLENRINEISEEKIVEGAGEHPINDNKSKEKEVDIEKKSNDELELSVETANDKIDGENELVENRETALCQTNVSEDKEKQIIEENAVEEQSDSYTLANIGEVTVDNEETVENSLYDDGLMEKEKNQYDSEPPIEMITESCVTECLFKFPTAGTETIINTEKLEGKELEGPLNTSPKKNCGNRESNNSDDQSEDLIKNADVPTLDPLSDQMGGKPSEA